MKRTYAAARLLEHGPLRFGEVLAITGWPESTVCWVLADLMAAGVVVADQAPGRGPMGLVKTYRLADGQPRIDGGAPDEVRQVRQQAVRTAGCEGLRGDGSVEPVGASGEAGCGDRAMAGGAA